jgi:hypothetical protein
MKQLLMQVEIVRPARRLFFLAFAGSTNLGPAGDRRIRAEAFWLSLSAE